MHRVAFVLLASASLLAGYCQSASAADLVRKAPIYKAPLLSPEPAGRWSGLYVGGNVGYGVARDPSQITHFITNFNLFFSADTFNLNPRGVLGGAQIGYNWQPSPQWVIGVETDIQGADQRASACVTGCRVDGFAQLLSRTTQELPWFGTVRARVGWTDGPTLYYVTAGLAYGRVTTDVTVDHIALGPATRSFSHDKTGWVVGAGIETELAGNWRVKAEYLYVDLGSVNDAFVAPTQVDLNRSTSEIRNHIARLGLNYKFGYPGALSAYASVPTKAPPAPATYSWSGFYLGANLGYGVAANPSRENVTSNGVLVFAEELTTSPHGVIGGGQIGYNWHWGPTWVVGVEADIQGSGQSDSTTCILICSPTTIASTRISQELSWFGTVRGRLGWANGAALYYVTGGWAFGHISTDVAFQFNAGAAAVDARSFSENLSGWTVGAGIETRIAQRWTAKAEYLYMDLGTTAASFAYVSLPTIRFASSSEIHNHVFRAGVNYRFDGWPIIASY